MNTLPNDIARCIEITDDEILSEKHPLPLRSLILLIAARKGCPTGITDLDFREYDYRVTRYPDQRMTIEWKPKHENERPTKHENDTTKRHRPL